MHIDHPARYGKHLLRRRLGLAAVLLSGIAASFILYGYSNYAEHRRTGEEFFRRAIGRHTLISENIRGYEECLYNLRNLFVNSEDVTPAEFMSTARDIRSRHDGIQALEWIPVVPASRREATEVWARREISPAFAFTERAPDGRLIPAAARDSHLPILYVDPLAGNESALGYDLSTGPTTADLERSVATRALVMTRKIRLVQEQPGLHRFGVVMACPVFKTVDGADRLQGFVQIVFRIDDLLNRLWVTFPANAFDTLILDLTQPAENDSFLYSRRADTAAPPLRGIGDIQSGDLHTDTLTIGGRTWNCYYAPSPAWLRSQTSGTPRIALGGGLLFTLVLGAYFLSVSRRSELVEQQVKERTAELRHTQVLLEADIVKRQSTEAELRESRRQLDSLLRQLPGMAYRCINQNRYTPVFISQGSLDIVGLHPSELLSAETLRFPDLILKEDFPRCREAFHEAINRHQIYEIEYRVHHKDGSVKWVLDRGQGIYSPENELLFVEGLVVDITARKEAELEKITFTQKLQESQKLESLGVLAGGIAHDFNNLLTTIVGHASITRLELPKLSPLQEHLKQIEAGAHRAAELCQQMLAYAGKGRFLVKRTHLETLVRDTIPLLEHSISKRAALYFAFRPDVPEVEVDLTQIRQIIMNLVVNASDAIGENDGSITVEICSLRGDDPQLQRAVLPPPPGVDTFACLRVSDTGSGMSAETLTKIFDPFFTTKFAGRGLGLAAVLGIVRGHQGSLLVQSTPGAGSAFTLLLPAAMPKPADPSSRTPFDQRAHPLSGTVLLVDDEDGVRNVAEQMFRAFGLKTLTAADGQEGVELFTRHQPEIALVMLDVTMPRMNGEEALRRIRALAPRIPVILMSGYNESAIPELTTDECLSFLQKPFSLEAVRKQIGKLLG